jgi:FkbM family methyltransferase
MARLNPSCSRVSSFEPNPGVFKLLAENAEINGADIEAHNVAIGSEVGTHQLCFKENHTGRGNLLGEGGQKVDVQVRNYEFLDEISATWNDRVVLKCDVEGFEPVVMTEILKSRIAGMIDEMFIEVVERRLQGNGAQVIFDAAARMGLKEAFRVGDKDHFDVYFRRG